MVGGGGYAWSIILLSYIVQKLFLWTKKFNQKLFLIRTSNIIHNF